MTRWIRLALKTAATGKHPQHLVGAVVVKGGNVLSKAANLSRPFGLDNCGFHAEERALREDIDYRGATIIVVRINSKSGNTGLSRPCIKCMKIIRSRGLKKIIYLSDADNACIERV